MIGELQYKNSQNNVQKNKANTEQMNAPNFCTCSVCPASYHT